MNIVGNGVVIDPVTCGGSGSLATVAGSGKGPTVHFPAKAHLMGFQRIGYSMPLPRR